MAFTVEEVLSNIFPVVHVTSSLRVEVSFVAGFTVKSSHGSFKDVGWFITSSAFDVELVVTFGDIIRRPVVGEFRSSVLVSESGFTDEVTIFVSEFVTAAASVLQVHCVSECFGVLGVAVFEHSAKFRSRIDTCESVTWFWFSPSVDCAEETVVRGSFVDRKVRVFALDINVVKSWDRPVFATSFNGIDVFVVDIVSVSWAFDRFAVAHKWVEDS